MAHAGLSFGKHVTVTTTDGHVLSGTVGLVAPDRVWIYYEAGIHVVYRRAVLDVSPRRPAPPRSA